MDSINLRTPLYDTHVALGGRMVPFGGWDMPVQYPEGILAEVRAVRTGTGIFDVSHMGRVYISGPSATDFLDWALTGSASTLAVGRARVLHDLQRARRGSSTTPFSTSWPNSSTCSSPTRATGPGVLDWFGQVIAQRYGDGKSLGWLTGNGDAGVTLDDQTMQTCLLACQGPEALGIAASLADNDLEGLRPFAWTATRMCGAEGPGGTHRIHRGGRRGGVGASRRGHGHLASADGRGGRCPAGWERGMCCGPRRGCPCTATSWMN